MKISVGSSVRVSDDSSPFNGTAGLVQSIRKSEFYRGRKFICVQLDGHADPFNFTCDQLTLDSQVTSVVKV